MTSFIIAILLFFGLTFAVNRLLLDVLPRFFYLALMFPGVVLHESAHLVGAVLTATPVSDVSFFSRTGGYVTHQKPKIPIVGQLFISIAPLILGLTVIYFISRQLPLELTTFTIPFTTTTISVPAFVSHWQWVDKLWLYILLSVSLTLAPSRQDLAVASTGVIALIALFILFYINKWLIINAELVALIWYINSTLILMLFFLWPITVMKRAVCKKTSIFNR